MNWLDRISKGLGESEEEQCIKSCLPMVLSIAKRFRKTDEDWLQMGVMVLVKAYKTWNREWMFSTHAHHCLHNAFVDAIKWETRPKRIPPPREEYEALSREPSPSYLTEVKLDAQQAWKAIPDREIVRQFLEGRSCVEIGRELGVCKQAIHQRVQKNLRQARRRL
jgi:RNA polymerase sigma factor (sigma-70 family)